MHLTSFSFSFFSFCCFHHRLRLRLPSDFSAKKTNKKHKIKKVSPPSTGTYQQQQLYQHQSNGTSSSSSSSSSSFAAALRSLAQQAGGPCSSVTATASSTTATTTVAVSSYSSSAANSGNSPPPPISSSFLFKLLGIGLKIQRSYVRRRPGQSGTRGRCLFFFFTHEMHRLSFSQSHGLSFTRRRITKKNKKNVSL